MKIDWDQGYLADRDYRIMNQLLLNDILQAVGSQPGGTTLDIGCGTGDLAVRLAKRGLMVLGIDLSTAAIEKAKERSSREKVSDHTDFQILDIESADQAKKLGDQTFDLITCKLVIAFLEDKAAFLAWVNSHLSKTGVFVLITPVLHSEIDYGPRLTNISVDYEELMVLLRQHFSKVQELHKDYFEELGDERTFILG